MNQNFSGWLWSGGVFGGVAISTFIVLQTIVLRWQGRGRKNETHVEPNKDKNPESTIRWANYALVSAAGLVAMFLLLKDSAWASFSVVGIFAIVPYAFLSHERIETTKWKTRASVLHFLETVQVLGQCQSVKSAIELCPWLERRYGVSTISKQLDARLADLVGQGLALRGNGADLEQIADEFKSDDLAQFIRRTRIHASAKSQVAQRAAAQISERMYLEAEDTIARLTGQAVWLWLGLIAVLGGATLILWRVM